MKISLFPNLPLLDSFYSDSTILILQMRIWGAFNV